MSNGEDPMTFMKVVGTISAIVLAIKGLVIVLTETFKALPTFHSTCVKCINYFKKVFRKKDKNA